MLQPVALPEAALRSASAPALDDADFQRPHEDTAAVAVSKRRGERLTAAEKVCFRRFPVPTPYFAEKFAHSHSEPTLRAAGTLPAADGQSKSGAVSVHRKQKLGLIQRQRRVLAPQVVGGMRPHFSKLEAQEENCKSILNSIYPSTFTGMANVRELLLSRGEKSRAARPIVSRQSSVLSSSSTGSLASALSPSSPASPSSLAFPLSPPRSPPWKPDSEFSRQPSLAGDMPSRCVRAGGASPIPAGLVPAEASSRLTVATRGDSKSRSHAEEHLQHSLQLLRERAAWDPAASAMSRTAIRLVQGSVAAGIERKLGGEVVLVGGDAEAAVEAPAEGRHAFTVKERKSKSDAISGFTSLRDFRTKLLRKFGCVHGAFNGIDLDEEKSLDKREWSTVLHEANLCSVREAKIFYDLIDSNRDGSLTLSEFENGIETVASVLSLEGLRKRFVCLRFKSVLQAIATMNGSGYDTTMVPLSEVEFAAALRRIWVIEPQEHRAIFDMIRNALQGCETVTLSELAMGLAALSPCLLLEEFKETLENATNGNLAEACQRLAPVGRTISENAFATAACKAFGVPRQTALRVYRLVNVDNSAAVSCSQLLAALRLSTPALTLENLRFRVLRSYRSIEQVLQEAYSGCEEAADLDVMRFDSDEILALLEPVSLDRKDLQRLLHLMDATGDKGITFAEFLRGIKLFAPAYVLHDIRVQLLQVHDSIADAFEDVGSQELRKPMNQQKLEQLLEQLQVRCHDHDRLFNLLDLRCSSCITMSEFIVALQCAQVGNRKWVPPAEQDCKVSARVRQEMAPYLRRVCALKAQVKEGFVDGHDMEDGTGRTESASSPGNSPISSGSRPATLPKVQGREQRETFAKKAKILAAFGGQIDVGRVELVGGLRSKESRGTKSRRAKSLPPGEDRSSLRPIAARRTFQKVTSTLQALGPGRSDEPIKKVRGYLENNHQLLGSQKPVLVQPYKRCAVQREAMELWRVEEEARGHSNGRKRSPSSSPTSGFVNEP